MLRHCLDCTTAYAVDLTACPHCRSLRFGFTESPQVQPAKPATTKPAIPAPRRATP
jgi:hypothetical protein